MFTLRFYCVICGTALEAAPETAHDLMECHCCSRYVPVPRPASLRGKLTDCPVVLPPRVLELSVTFQCTQCGSRLRTDARWEGREIDCPDCREKTGVPRWSTIPSWPRVMPGDELPSVPTPRAAGETKAPVLSIEEINFLRGAPPEDSGAVA